MADDAKGRLMPQDFPPRLSMPMRTLILATAVTAVFAPYPAEAKNTGFDPRIVTFGEAREEIKSTPITQRPYRPLHVYGNTVRRRHERANAAPPPSRQNQR